MDLLIKNATIFTMDEKEEMIKGSLLIDGTKIKAIFPHALGDEPNIQAREIMDGSSLIILPGMTNAHYHSYSNLLKGTESSLPLELWSLYTVAYGHSLQDEDIALAVQLGVIEQIRSGVTCCIDHFPHIARAEAALKSYEQTGIRVGFAPMMHDVPDHHFLRVQLPNKITERIEAVRPKSVDWMREFYTTLLKYWNGKNNKIRILLGPNAPQRCSKEMLSLCKDLSISEKMLVHTHLLESKVQKYWGDRSFSKGLVGKLNEAGLLNERLSTAHSVWLEEQEQAALAEKGVTFVHNPASNMMLGSGRAAVGKWLKYGANVALGTDSSNCGISHNMFETMRLAVMLHRYGNEEEVWIKPIDTLKMATIGGAKLLGEADCRGKIKVGYEADLVLINKAHTPYCVETDLATQLVLYESGHSIEALMVAGEWLMKDKKLITIDEQKVITSVQERSSEFLKRCPPAVREVEELLPYFREMYESISKEAIL